MSKATTKTLVTNMALSQSQGTTVEKFYQDTIQQISQFNLLTQVQLISATEGTSQYTATDDIGKIIAMFYDDDILSRESLESVSMGQTNWRDVEGKPYAFIKETENAKVFRLFPNPQDTSKSFAFLVGASFGIEFPEYSIGIIHTEIRSENPGWLDLVLALLILTKEFNQESSYQDINLARACDATGNALLGLIANATNTV